MTIREAGEKLEQFFLEVIRERRHDTAGTILKGILFLASRIYHRAVLFRLWLYDNRVIRNRAIGCLVVSIGNVTCGGTGKTPVVEVFARSLSAAMVHMVSGKKMPALYSCRCWPDFCAPPRGGDLWLPSSWKWERC